MINILAVIPSRLGSSRLPRKPLAMIGNKPLVQHVYEAAKKCSFINKVIVATDSQEIVDCVKKFGGNVEMTDVNHQSGSDRVAEVATRHPEAEVIINVQGDQPFVTAAMLHSLVKPYLDGKMPEVTTLACPTNNQEVQNDSNSVKVVCNLAQQALYFSRSLIPFPRTKTNRPILHHIGLYAFKRDFLMQFCKMQPTELEQIESLEQLRILDHGHKILVCLSDQNIMEINTPEDLEKARKLIQAK